MDLGRIQDEISIRKLRLKDIFEVYININLFL